LATVAVKVWLWLTWTDEAVGETLMDTAAAGAEVFVLDAIPEQPESSARVARDVSKKTTTDRTA
jgi:hypothetical protein